jgi:cation transport ATPase
MRVSVKSANEKPSSDYISRLTIALLRQWLHFSFYFVVVVVIVFVAAAALLENKKKKRNKRKIGSYSSLSIHSWVARAQLFIAVNKLLAHEIL